MLKAGDIWALINGELSRRLSSGQEEIPDERYR